MEKKVEALKAAYAKNDRAALVKASKALIAHDRKHPFAVTLIPRGFDILGLARRIVAAA